MAWTSGGQRRVFSSSFKGFVSSEVRGLGRCYWGGLYADSAGLFLSLVGIIHFKVIAMVDVERKVPSSNFKVFVFRFSRPSSWAGTM